MEKINRNDPRFTAKALNEELEELDGIEIDNGDLAEFEELQEFAAKLKSKLQSTVGEDGLTADQLAAIKQESQKTNKKRVVAFPLWMGSLAACLTLGFISYLVVRETGGVFDSPESELRRIQAVRVGVDAPPPNMPENKPREPVDSVRYEKAKDEGLAQATAEFLNESGRDGIRGEREFLNLSPFTVDASSDQGYRPTTTIAGTRITTEISDVTAPIEPVSEARFNSMKETEFELAPFTAEASDDKGYRAKGIVDLPADVASSVSVVTEEVMEDVAASDSQDMLVYGVSSQVGRVQGNFAARKRIQYSDPRRHNPVDTLAGTPITPPSVERFNREGYDFIEENAFVSPLNQQLSTFSIDVDTASYANTRRFINQGRLPPADAVRIEELVNYFRYQYQEPTGDAPFSVKVDAANTPWAPEHRLVRIALKGMEVDREERPDANLVFLVDVSGSMSNQNKLPLVQESLKILVDQMEGRDRIAIVVYAGASGLALPSTTANNKETIKHAIDQLRSGGSTNGGAGITLAYQTAQSHFIEGGINRVILCTDGDFNVGATNQGDLTRLIEEKRQSNVFFSILGFGMGNYRDGMMETLSNKGNGNYAYIDSRQEAHKVFVDEMMGSLQTIAKDVKIQVEFNPAEVEAYRLIGYENRKLAKEDFNDDTKDAGEIGAGHRVTALYEVVPAGVTLETGSVDPLKYQRPEGAVAKGKASREMLTVKLRYKEPEGETSQLIEQPFTDEAGSLEQADEDFRFATAVAGWGMLLRDSQHKGTVSIQQIIDLASSAKGNDSGGLRSEFVELVRKSGEIRASLEIKPE